MSRRALAAQRLPDDIRAKGWFVASHRDEVDDGVMTTYWTFRKPGTTAIVTGEGKTDRDALNMVRRKIENG
jgi:anti-sigma factor RsiW